MADCAVISTNLNKNCDNPLVGGVRDNIYLINFSDWLDAVFVRNGLNSQIYESITLPSGALAYRMEGINNSPEPSTSFKRLAFAELFEHIVKYKIFDITPSAKEQLELKSKGRFVAIVENNYKGATGNAAFEIYGADSGLIVPDGGLTRDPNSTDTQGAYDVTLQTSEKSLEPHLPATLFITDYATTKAVLEALAVA